MNRKSILGIVLLLICMWFVPCAYSQNTSNTKPSTEQPEEDQENLASEYLAQMMGVALKSGSNLSLYKVIYDWIGTPYRLGGKSKNGVDCSGFVGEIYSKVFNMMLGDNSRKIFEMVEPVSKTALQEGDIVFFKIRSRSITHVGIYLGGDKFAHSSSSNGVRISNLNEGYWKRYFFRGGRVLPEYRSQLGLTEKTN